MEQPQIPYCKLCAARAGSMTVKFKIDNDGVVHCMSGEKRFCEMPKEGN